MGLTMTTEVDGVLDRQVLYMSIPLNETDQELLQCTLGGWTKRRRALS